MPPRPPLRAEIRTNGTTLFVTNPTTDDYDHAEITIRSGGHRYVHTEKIIRPGQTAALPLRWFVADDGRRFDPLTLAVQSVTISAAVVGVRGESTYEFSR